MTTGSPQAQQEAELKPCPFCGYIPTLWQQAFDKRWRLGCGSAGCFIQSQMPPNTDKTIIIDLWNTRADLPRATGNSCRHCNKAIRRYGAAWIHSESQLVSCRSHQHGGIERATPRATEDDNALHWRFKAGTEEAMCGQSEPRYFTLLGDAATCVRCQAVWVGYKFGRGDAALFRATEGEGVAIIAAERRRQLEKEGWTPEHDDEHKRGQMAIAAACYAVEGTDARVEYPDDDPEGTGWPWGAEWFKPKGDIHDLARAGALIAAEIDRLRRTWARSSKGEMDAEL